MTFIIPTINFQPKNENFLDVSLSELVEDVYRLALSPANRGAPASELGLAVELHRVRAELEVTKEQLKQCQDDLKRRGEALLDTTSKLSVCEIELRGALEERDQARLDLDNSASSKDSVVVEAYHARDQAVARKNCVEVMLAKARIDNLQANSLLIEAVQQKVELSEKLEQFQLDMQVYEEEKSLFILCIFCIIQFYVDSKKMGYYTYQF